MRYDVSQEVFQQEKGIQLFFRGIQLFLQFLVVRGKNPFFYQYEILRLHFFFEVAGSRSNPFLQCFVRSIVLRGVNQTVVLHTELLRHYHHLLVKTFRFCLVCCQLLGIEFIKMLVNQAYIALKRLLQRPEIE